MLSQDYPNVEYIIMDGGSTDETAAVVSEYASRVRWISEKDRGQSHAINKGFRMAKGELVSWLNSDDVILPNALRLAARAFQQNPALGAVYGEGYQIDIDGNIRQTFPCTEPFNLWKLIHLSDYILQQSSYFRKAVLDEVGYLDEDLHYAPGLGPVHPHRQAVRAGIYPGAHGVDPGVCGCEIVRGRGEAVRGAGADDAEAYRNALPAGVLGIRAGHLYSDLVPEAGRTLPAPLARLGQYAIRFTGGNIIAQVAQQSQGLYADRWAGPKLRYMLNRGSGRVAMRGVLPDLSPVLRDQEIEVTCNGKVAGAVPGAARRVSDRVRSAAAGGAGGVCGPGLAVGDPGVVRGGAGLPEAVVPVGELRMGVVFGT